MYRFIFESNFTAETIL